MPSYREETVAIRGDRAVVLVETFIEKISILDRVGGPPFETRATGATFVENTTVKSDTGYCALTTSPPSPETLGTTAIHQVINVRVGAGGRGSPISRGNSRSAAAVVDYVTQPLMGPKHCSTPTDATSNLSDQPVQVVAITPATPGRDLPNSVNTPTATTQWLIHSPTADCLNPVLESAIEMPRCALTSQDDKVLQARSGDPCVLIDALDMAIRSPSTGPENAREYLLSLTKICGQTGLLPSSHILTEPLSKLGDAPIASGGFGDVWDGMYNGRRVAIKALKICQADSPEVLRKRFCQEVILWKRLSHPNVVPLYGVSTELSSLCMVSEWMSHGHIRKYVRVNPGVNRLQLLTDVASGLNYLHSSGLVHGDLKGDNILVNDSGTACLSDFGLSSVTRTLMAATSKQGVYGSVRWMAPELFDPEDAGHESTVASPASDVFAMSMVVIEVLTGKLPFHQYRDEAVLFKIAKGIRPDKPTDASELGISDGVWEMVRMCWQHEPVKRPEMLYALGCFLRAAGNE